MNKIALITGASSGIGKATAIRLQNEGYTIIACGRREENLKKLVDSFNDESIYLTFDVRNKQDVFNKINSLSDKYKKIDVLINNAGNAHGLDSFQNASIDDWDAMIDINVKGLYYVTKATLNYLLPDAHIVNLGSIAGKEVYPNGNMYCASKHAVHALSESMRIDLLEKGIKITNIAPGLVQTEFSLIRFKGDKERAENVYKGYQPLNPEDIADAIFYALSRPKHVNIADILILPSQQASSTIVKKS